MVIVLVKEMLREFVGRAEWVFCVWPGVTSAISHQLRSGDASGRIVQFETASTSEVAGGRNAAAASQRRPGQFDTCGHAPEPISKPPPLRAYHLPERWDLFA
jgi:hypothetical protein